MSDHIQKTIDDALAELRKQEAAVLFSKKFINQLCGFGKLPMMFPDLDESVTAQRGGIKRNAFYGQPLATSVGQYLDWRMSSGLIKEATLDEIMTALKEGGFDFSTITKDAEGQKRGVAITLGKNTNKFHRLPNGDFGLTAWYSNVRAKKEKPSEPTAPDAPSSASSEPFTILEEDLIQPPQNQPMKT